MKAIAVFLVIVGVAMAGAQILADTSEPPDPTGDPAAAERQPPTGEAANSGIPPAGLLNAKESYEAQIQRHDVSREQMSKARARQAELAKQHPKLDIYTGPSVGAPFTVMRGTPPEIANLVVNDHRDIDDVIPKLGKYLAFTGSEDLEFLKVEERASEWIYYYVERLRGIRFFTPTVTFTVDKESRRVIDARFDVTLDSSTMRRTALSKRDAIQIALQEQGAGAFLKGGHTATASFYSIEGIPHLGWSVRLKLKEPIVMPDPLVPAITYEQVWVFSRDRVEDRSIDLHSQSLVCDMDKPPATYQCFWYAGAPAQNVAVDPQGNCRPGFSCSGATNKYRVPYEVGTGVDAMWKDLLDDQSCCNVGENSAWGYIEFRVDDTVSQPTYSLDWGDILKSASVKLPTASAAFDPAIYAHELGHALYFHQNPHFAAFPRGNSNPTERQNAAVLEAVADINAIIYKNYDPSKLPPFEPNPSFTVAGRNLASQKDMSDITPLTSPHQYGLVGGHAFYELVQRVGFAQAAVIFLKSINSIVDRNPRNNGISFMELRDATLSVSGVFDNPALKDAVQDAWHDVEVGPAGSGGANAPIDPNPSAPDAPVLSGVQTGCIGTATTGNLTWTPESGANNYLVYGTINGIISFIGSTHTTSQAIYTKINTHWRVRACDGADCSLYSNAWAQNDVCE